jgi:hypothetical protein
VSFKTKVLAGTGAFVMALAGTVMATATNATAGGPTVTPGPGTSITCTGLKAKATITPALKENWIQSQHASDPDPIWVAGPNTEYTTESPTTTTSATGKANCTGNVVSGGHSYAVSKVSFSATSTSTNTVEGPWLNPPTNTIPNPFAGKTLASCSGLATQNGQNSFSTTVTLSSKVAVIPPITITSSLNTLFDTHGAGFDLHAVSATGVTGTIAGDTIAYVDAKTVTAIASSPPTSTVQPKNECEPSAKDKKGALALKAPKGLSKIKIGNGIFDQTPSSITLNLS